MTTNNSIWLITGLALVTACNTSTEKEMNTSEQAPSPKKIAHEMTIHGDTRIDNYFWMRLSDDQKNADSADEQTQDVIDYLNAENKYLDKTMAHTKKFQDQLFDEIVGRIKQDDQSVPVTIDGYSYFTRYEEGQDYAYHCRTKANDSSAEENIMLNGPEMAKGHEYFAIGGTSVSSDNNLLAYGIDTVSRRQYTLHVKNLSSGELLEDKIVNTTGRATWANDNKTLFYTQKDPVTLRSYRIYKHVLGSPQSEDKLVYEETDETFDCGIYKSKSKEYLIIGSYQTLSTEYRYLDANTPDGAWKIVHPREVDLEYHIDHYENDFYISTNYNAKNFRLMKTEVANTAKENWKEVIGNRDDVLLEGIDIFKNHLVVSERKNGLTGIRIIQWSDWSEHYIEFNDPAYLAYTSANPEFNTEVLRFGYTSMTTPNSVYDYDMNSKEKALLKQQEIIDDQFSPDNYQSERLYAEVRDGAKVPISLVYKKGTELSEKTPLLLYAYGSYGNSMDPYFSSVRLSLLDRGFVYAIAHIRGGQEMGRYWYEDGKLLKKKNTFYDFIDCAQYLIKSNYTSAGHLYAQGGSAGGLLMGAVVNMEPELWNGVIAAVPFVDVVSTMMDESIPLTTSEFDEWGNPKDSTYYEYIKSYSPYDNVEQKAYPNLLVTTGYWDSQVQYWEPAKWVAKLRELKTDDHLLLLSCNMDVGHGGASGRFKRYKEVALEYAFLMDLEGIKE